MPWTITQNRNGWIATDTSRGIELSAPTRSDLDEMIAKIEAAEQPRPEVPLEERLALPSSPVSREAEAAAFQFWTGRGPLPVTPQHDSIQARFERFHAANSHIHARLVEAARRLKAAKRRSASAILLRTASVGLKSALLARTGKSAMIIGADTRGRSWKKIPICVASSRSGS